MKKLHKPRLSLLLVLLLILTLTAQPVSAAGKTPHVQVTFVRAELTENNHVGNEWAYAAYVNGQELEEGSSVTLSAGSSGSIKLKAVAEEQDKIPESGTASLTLQTAGLKSAKTSSLNVTVTENRGRYSGHTATWKFVFRIEKTK
ncbi:hypothetical protein F4V43_11375 [Paenibacillus spiritus]|uniref:WxL domain-containing protein n=1 Tax=Paenibacillus spiritus TaxID=2496557 RepID=A0A5J5G8R4_9BACL|nr:MULTISPECIES: hypothetical protein [Paenibacillus]KAA9004002.1 hypothetical protein F4V43_11375 [Paenibacillus spiritus]